MAKNYLIYPCKTLRITQSYTGTTSHLPHTTGSPKDYPWDEGCSDTGRDWCYCPCDEMVVKRIYGVGTKGTNTIWLESTSKVYFADGTADYFTMLITHPNDDDLKKIKVGQTFKRKVQICREGVDGATGYHFHFSGGKGKYKGNGWTQNSKGKYVLTTTGGTYKPQELFFIDKSFTTIKNAKSLVFKELPKEEVKPTSTTTATTDKNTSATTKYFKKYTGKSSSIVEALTSIGASSSFSYRKKIANANGIKAYIGTATQNTKLLTLLKQGKLITP